MALAPAIINSRASLLLVIPPIPISGKGVAFLTCQSILKAIGFIAGPESPPRIPPNFGILVSTSRAIAEKVFTKLKISAPALSADFAIRVMSVTLGESLTKRGTLVCFFAALTKLKVSSSS